MYFRNLQCYRISTEWPITIDGLHKQLEKRGFKPCEHQEVASHGWVPPCDGAELVHAIGDNWLMCLQSETKMLPTAVINREANKRAEKIGQDQGFIPGRKFIKDLREQVATEFLPRAFSRHHTINAWLNIQKGWLVIDAATKSKAETVVEMLRRTLDTFPLSLLETVHPPVSAMSMWLRNEPPAGFTIDSELALQSIGADGARIAFSHYDAQKEEITAHLEAARLPTKLALTFDSRVSFVLTENFDFKRIEFLDVVRDEAKADDHEDARALFDAEFALMTGELLRLLDAVVDALGGERQREPDLVDQAKKQAA